MFEYMLNKQINIYLRKQQIMEILQMTRTAPTTLRLPYILLLARYWVVGSTAKYNLLEYSHGVCVVEQKCRVIQVN